MWLDAVSMKDQVLVWKQVSQREVQLVIKKQRSLPNSDGKYGMGVCSTSFQSPRGPPPTFLSLCGFGFPDSKGGEIAPVYPASVLMRTSSGQATILTGILCTVSVPWSCRT